MIIYSSEWYVGSCLEEGALLLLEDHGLALHGCPLSRCRQATRRRRRNDHVSGAICPHLGARVQVQDLRGCCSCRCAGTSQSVTSSMMHSVRLCLPVKRHLLLLVAYHPIILVLAKRSSSWLRVSNGTATPLALLVRWWRSSLKIYVSTPSVLHFLLTMAMACPALLYS